MGLWLQSRAFSLPKRGNSEQENEDAYRRNDSLGRYALSDGATEGRFHAWAIQLVERYEFLPLEDLSVEHVLGWLPKFSVPSGGDSHSEEIRDIPWFWDRAEERGSFATFLGLRIIEDPSDELKWEAVAIGDSCLFQVSADKLASSFPLNWDHDFSDSPFLISTVKSKNYGIDKALSAGTGSLVSGDHLILATDALAAWVCARARSGEWSAKRLLEVSTELEFTRFIDHERDEKRIRNDDCTLVVIEVLPALRSQGR
ncbi:MAG: hypothetical protein IPG75_19790 [Gemmatimonadetes bacterium]|nr:hypothetical protein [Gemmatimonadota bacterium]